MLYLLSGLLCIIWNRIPSCLDVFALVFPILFHQYALFLRSLHHTLIMLTAQNYGSLRDLNAAAHLWDSTVHNLLKVEESMYVAAVRSPSLN